MKPTTFASIAALATALTACGGGGGNGLAFIPPPPPAPAPPPPAPPPIPAPTPTPPPPVAVSQDTDFTSVGSDIRIRYVEATKNYEIMLPTADWATLVPATGNRYDIQDSSGAKPGYVYFSGVEAGKYTYTGFADVITSAGGESFLAYGVPTSVSGVPVAGSATYVADVAGSGGGYFIGGNARLDFDFAAGTLSGSMSLGGNDKSGWGPYDFGAYDFQQTVYSAGSTSFSGALARNGTAAGSFSGSFTGPQAQELMGKWGLALPDFYQPDATVNVSGVFVGKKGP